MRRGVRCSTSFAAFGEVGPVEAKLNMSVPSESLVRGTGTIAVAVPKETARRSS